MPEIPNDHVMVKRYEVPPTTSKGVIVFDVDYFDVADLAHPSLFPTFFQEPTRIVISCRSGVAEDREMESLGQRLCDGLPITMDYWVLRIFLLIVGKEQ